MSYFPNQLRFLTGISGEDLSAAAGKPVWVAADGLVYRTGADEVSTVGCLGLLETAVPISTPVRVLLSSQVLGGQAGLVVGSEYFLSSGSLVLYAAVPPASWTRSMGLALTATTMMLAIGSVFQR